MQCVPCSVRPQLRILSVRSCGCVEFARDHGCSLQELTIISFLGCVGACVNKAWVSRDDDDDDDDEDDDHDDDRNLDDVDHDAVSW